MRTTVFVFATLCLWLGLAPASALDDSAPCFAKAIQQLYSAERGKAEALYRQLHQHPELSFREEQTAKRLAEEFRAAGFEVKEHVGKHGVVAVLRNGEGPTVLIRTDMDGLPVLEETKVEYASNAVSSAADGTVPTMHACGHDVHMASVASTARVLAKLREKWRGTLVVIGQPAEEIGAGARAMLGDGLFKRFPRPDYLLAHHVDPSLQVGRVSIRSGYFTANVDSVDILVKGRGGHGAYPHKSKDPVVIASQIVVALQTIVSREVKPIESAVVTVGSIHGGTKHNIIPNEVKLQLTVRTYTDEVRQQVLDSIRRISRGIAMTAGLSEDLYPVVTLPKKEFTPAGYNSPELAKRARTLWSKVLGPEAVVEGEASMGGEDFAVYGKQKERIPSLMFRLGAVSEKNMRRSKRKGADPLPPLHSSGFLPAYEDAIEMGTLTMSTFALELLEACP